MSKYLSIISGVALMAFGGWGIWVTWPLMWVAVKATVPACCLVAGLFIFLVGAGEAWDSLTARKPPAPPSGKPSQPSAHP